LWNFLDLADVLVGSQHIDQSKIVGIIDYVVLSRELVFERKAKKRGSKRPESSYPQTPT